MRTLTEKAYLCIRSLIGDTSDMHHSFLEAYFARTNVVEDVEKKLEYALPA